ncbi:MAG: hypothetical protein ABW178_02265 [Pseudoxanthomonas sp.]
MQGRVTFLSLALVTLALAATAAWLTPLSFPAALVLVASGVLAQGFVLELGPQRALTGGVAGQVQRGVAMGLRLLIGTGALVSMLVGLLWSLGHMTG